MKRYVVFVWLLLAGIGVCLAQPADEHPDPAKKAMVNELSEWNEGFWHYFKEGEYDEILNTFSPQIVFVASAELYSYPRLKNLYNSWAEKNITFDITIDSMRVQCLGDEHAAITTFGFSEQTNAKGEPYYTRFNCVSVLEKTEEDWQVNSLHEYTNSSPLLYHADLPIEWCKGEASEGTKFFVSMWYMYIYLFEDLAHSKSLGVSVEERATALGNKFAKTWPDDVPFERFCNAFLRNMQAATSRCELVQRNDEQMKIRNYKVYKPLLSEDLSDEEVVKFFEIVIGKVAEYNGVDFAMIDEGDYYTQVFTKKE